MGHYQQVIDALGPNYRVLSNVEAWNSRVTVRCKTHRLEFTARADSLKAGNIGCKTCRGERIKAGRGEFTEEFRAAARVRATKSFAHHASAMPPTIKLLAVGANHRGDFSCQGCGHEWQARLDSVKAGKGCPVCARVTMSLKKRKEPHERISSTPGYKQAWSDTGHLTRLVYKRYKHLLDPGNLRSKHWHIDHIYSVHDWWHQLGSLKYPITQLELCHPANMQMLDSTTNIRKNKRSWISATELRRRIREWNRQYGRPFKLVDGVVFLN